MSIFNNVWALSLTAGALIFIVSYLQFDKFLRFMSEKSFGVQQEILMLTDKLLITQDKKKFKRNLWLMTGGMSALVFVALWPRILISLGAALAVFTGSWYLIKAVFQKMWENHCNRVVHQMVEALTIMCNSLKVGLSLAQAMERVIKGYPGPLAKEFGLVLNKMSLGQNLEESLEQMAERVNRPDIEMLVSTVSILKETGGNLAETFYVMAETMRERQKMDKKIKALTAQGVMQAKIISCLPFILVGILYVMDKPYVAPLIFKPLGWLCLGAVLVLVLVGWFMMKKMVEIKI